MRYNLIIVKASIYLLTPEEGGRTTGIQSGYRPNHVFEWPRDLKDLNSCVGDIQFDDHTLMHPGQTKSVTVRFLPNPIIEKYIRVGQKWFICEGARLVAKGDITEV